MSLTRKDLASLQTKHEERHHQQHQNYLVKHTQTKMTSKLQVIKKNMDNKQTILMPKQNDCQLQIFVESFIGYSIALFIKEEFANNNSINNNTEALVVGCASIIHHTLSIATSQILQELQMLLIVLFVCHLQLDSYAFCELMTIRGWIFYAVYHANINDGDIDSIFNEHYRACNTHFPNANRNTNRNTSTATNINTIANTDSNTNTTKISSVNIVSQPQIVSNKPKQRDGAKISPNCCHFNFIFVVSLIVCFGGCFLFSEKKWFDTQNKRRIDSRPLDKQYCDLKRDDKSIDIKSIVIWPLTCNQEICKERYQMMNLLLKGVVMEELEFKKLVRKKKAEKKQNVCLG